MILINLILSINTILINLISSIIEIPHVCQPSNLHSALLQELDTALLNFTLPFILLTPLIPLLLPPAVVVPTTLPTFYANLIEDISVLLELDNASQFNADLNFPPLLDTKTDCAIISWYQLYIKTVINKLKAICYYCDSFISIEEWLTSNIDSKLMLQSLSSGLIMLSDLDSYGIIDRKFRFCK